MWTCKVTASVLPAWALLFNISVLPVWSISGYCHGWRACPLLRHRKQINPEKAAGTWTLLYRSCLLSAPHSEDFTIMSQGPGPGRQTDKVRMGQHGPSDKMDKTRGERCPAITGVNKRRSGGHSRHQYGRLTGAVTALTLWEQIINANEEASRQQQHKKGHFCPQQRSTRLKDLT